MSARADESRATSLPAQAPDDTPALLVRAAEGDGHAWRLLLDRYARRVFALAQSRLRDADTAEEVTQSVFVTIAEHLGSGAYAEQGRFESWLFRVAANRVRDEARRRRRHAIPTDPANLPETPAQDGDPDDLDRFAALRAALSQLADADRTVIELRHHAGLGFREIAECLGEPLGTLLARHHRALRKLRGILEASMSEGETP